MERHGSRTTRHGAHRVDGGRLSGQPSCRSDAAQELLQLQCHGRHQEHRHDHQQYGHCCWKRQPRSCNGNSNRCFGCSRLASSQQWGKCNTRDTGSAHASAGCCRTRGGGSGGSGGRVARGSRGGGVADAAGMWFFGVGQRAGHHQGGQQQQDTGALRHPQRSVQIFARACCSCTCTTVELCDAGRFPLTPTAHPPGGGWRALRRRHRGG